MKKNKVLLLALIIAILVLFFVLPGFIKSLIHYETVKKYSAKYSVDPALVIAIIYAESSFMPRAKSPKGALGLMQVLPSTFEEIKTELGIEGDESLLKVPEVNIRVGIYYLNKLTRQGLTDKVELLAAYNAGRTKVRLWKRNNFGKIEIDSIPYRETREYIKRVQRAYMWTRKIF